MGVNLQNQTYNGIEYQCKIILVDNRMSRMDNEPRKLYAIVELKPVSGDFKNNWKLKSFHFNEEAYTDFEDNSLLGKDPSVYKSTVREISSNYKTSKTKLTFLNNTMEELIFKYEYLEVQTVH